MSLFLPGTWYYHTNKLLVNELSGTTELEPTLIRAEALFRKFQRAVEAIDKKENFPAPRKSNTSSETPATGSSASKGKNIETANKVITPELRKLLSRKVEILPRQTVAKFGDGMPGK